jgi:hypothetical protein
MHLKLYPGCYGAHQPAPRVRIGRHALSPAQRRQPLVQLLLPARQLQPRVPQRLGSALLSAAGALERPSQLVQLQARGRASHPRSCARSRLARHALLPRSLLLSAVSGPCRSPPASTRPTCMPSRCCSPPSSASCCAHSSSSCRSCCCSPGSPPSCCARPSTAAASSSRHLRLGAAAARRARVIIRKQRDSRETSRQQALLRRLTPPAAGSGRRPASRTWRWTGACGGAAR